MSVERYRPNFSPQGEGGSSAREEDEKANSLEEGKGELESRTLRLTGEEVAGILSSERFLKGLEVAALETRRTGLETFAHLQLMRDKKVFSSDVRRGSTDSTTQNAEVTTVLKMDGEHEPVNERHEYAPFFYYHFHPEEAGKEIIIPSSTDLEKQIRFESDDVPPTLTAVAQVDRRGNVVMLVTKVKLILTKEDVDLYEEGINAIHPVYSRQEELQQLLQEIGIESTILRFERDKSALQLSSDSRETLKKWKELKVMMNRMDEDDEAKGENDETEEV